MLTPPNTPSNAPPSSPLDAPPDLRLDLAEGFEPSAVPARAGVVTVDARDGRCVTVAASGDLRAFCAKRLGPDPAPGVTNLGEIAAALDVRLVGSAFEGDLLTLELARGRLPETYRALADRWRAWYVRLDPDADPPVWRKTDLHDLSDAERASPGAIVGPISTKDGAKKYGRALDDAFELCRYPRELALAPRGQACAYKEMGRCPGACDGSEPMDAYRARARDAIACAREGAGVRLDPVRTAMTDAAASRDFERAGALRASLEALEALARPAFRRARPVDDLAHALVLPGVRAGWARVVAFVAGELVPIAEVSGDASIEDRRAIAERVRTLAAGAGPFPLNPASIERLGVISTHWVKPAPKGRRRRPRVLDLRDGLDAPALGRALKSAAHPGEDDAFRETEVGA